MGTAAKDGIDDAMTKVDCPLRAAGFGDTTEVSNLLHGSGRSRGKRS